MSSAEPVPVRRAITDAADGREALPMVSVVVPAYNEVDGAQKNLDQLVAYLGSLEDAWRWELLLVNDGSTDGTGDLLDAFARGRANVHVLHHTINLGLGEALRYGFAHSQGDVVVVLDFDLTYAPDHIRDLLERILQTGAKVVVTSPYMQGGRVRNVPWLRRTLSVWANRFLSFATHGRLSTLTGMVRAYDGPFIRSLSLRSAQMDINPEVLYKAMLLNARVEEIPGRLDWGPIRAANTPRRPSMRMVRHTLQVLVAGFLFRPVLFFIVPGGLVLLFSFYVNSWMFVHFFTRWASLAHIASWEDRASTAVGLAYQQYPYTFIVGLISLVLALQLLSLGIVALQNREYFQELFVLGTRIHRYAKQSRKELDHE